VALTVHHCDRRGLRRPYVRSRDDASHGTDLSASKKKPSFIPQAEGIVRAVADPGSFTPARYRRCSLLFAAAARLYAARTGSSTHFDEKNIVWRSKRVMRHGLISGTGMQRLIEKGNASSKVAFVFSRTGTAGPCCRPMPAELVTLTSSSSRKKRMAGPQRYKDA